MFQTTAFQNTAFQLTNPAAVAPAFQPGAFQGNAWQTANVAFQPGAFQYLAFQTQLKLTIPAPERPAGGWGWSNEYQRELARRLRRKLALEDDEALVEAALEAAGAALPAEAAEAPADDPARLRALVEGFARESAANARRTERAIDYAQRAKSAFAYELAIREIARQLEEEEHALLHVLIGLD